MRTASPTSEWREKTALSDPLIPASEYDSGLAGG